ncbi:helix-turn-helix domain-containing protein [Micromonospora sp. ATA51]|uniref:helix-turn-helix domain-containing protein n=1 Tax=Micromonospora sp. ATA51 TaxID=2806098 RepID=UPI001A540C65|nr:helix-turn-helix domain-containing protein [Micromonospora sp. ATA51]MBM0224522.1 helix-turn-helix domain-containing protein [Micromonospora sp. ATA51]
MQYDLSTMTPATRAVLEALRDLGEGNVNELADKSGKAVSTVHKALKTFAGAGLITEVDTGADPAEGTPARWTIAEGVLTEGTDLSIDADLGDDDQAGGDGDDTDLSNGDASDTDAADGGDEQPADEPDGTDADQDSDDDADDDDADDDDADDDDAEDDTEEDEDGDEDDSDDDPEDEDDADEDDQGKGRVTIVQPSRPGDRKVMAIKGVLAEFGEDGATLDQIVAESGIGHPTASRLLTAMEQADAARRLPGTPGRWIAGPTKASDVDPNPEPPRCPLCFQVVKGLSESPEAVAQVMPLVRPDATLHVVAEDGTAHVVTLPKRMPIRTAGIATAGVVRRTDVTVNADGNQPFGKGELERLTFDTLKANPGRTMTPQEIATAISGQLGGRAVSSGAVRNNCGKLGAAGRILMVSESPWAFQYPAPAEDGNAAPADAPSEDGHAVSADDAMGEQS